MINYAGKRFGKLTILGVSHREGRSLYWKARCDCGGEKTISSGSIRGGKGFHCDCQPRTTGRRIDITGKKYGELTVLDFVRMDKKHGSVWRCSCSCGKEKDIVGNDLRTSHTKSCGCKQYTGHRTTHGETKGEKWSDRYYLWSNAKHRSSKKKLPFDIALEDIVIPDKCPLLGIDLVRGTFESGPLRSSPTLDQIRPGGGYVKGNIWVISNKANTIKSDASLEELKTLIGNLEKKINELDSNTSENKSSP